MSKTGPVAYRVLEASVHNGRAYLTYCEDAFSLKRFMPESFRKTLIGSERALPEGKWITANHESNLRINKVRSVPFISKVAESDKKAIDRMRKHHWLGSIQDRVSGPFKNSSAKKITPIGLIKIAAAGLAIFFAPGHFNRIMDGLGAPKAPPVPASGNMWRDAGMRAAHNLGRIVILMTPAHYDDNFRADTITAAQMIKQNTSAEVVDRKIIDNAMFVADPMHKLDKIKVAEQQQNLAEASLPYLRFLQQNADKFANGDPSKADMNEAYNAAWKLRTAEDTLKGSLIPKYQASNVSYRHHVHRHHHHRP